METYLYFRDVSAIADDDDGVAGSLLFPVSSLKGMCMGSGAITGTITQDEDRLAIFFEPSGIGEGTGDSDAGDNDVDVVNVDFSTVNEPQPIMKAIVEAANSHPNSDCFIVIYDSITGESVHPDISGLTVVRASND
tara:strand:- start:110 stop:517 length:408 start_codon:yes stop_codon:yes gene_type:complete